MRFYSTADKTNLASLREAVLGGMPADGGLYMPETIPRLPDSFLNSLQSMDYQSISFEIARRLLGDDIPGTIVKNIIDDAINFPAPLVNIEQHIKTLELFHGPTLAFKDVGARFMSRLMAYLVKDCDRELTILVATSGDTGSAVANGFFQVPGINVLVLYPADKVSLIQEKQIATIGENITALKVDGTFDDCQRLVKTALVDQDIKECLTLTTANSINISRLIPQSFYYFNAFRQIENYQLKTIAFCVPGGNFGNLTAGLIAKRMGLPVQRFIAATNINHIVPDYLESGVFRPKPSVRTISNAMDVGNPSNFIRMMDIYDSSWKNIKSDIYGAYYSDDETRRAITIVKQQCGYTLDPHGAVAYLGLKDHLAKTPGIDIGIFLETAHPAKFKDIVEPIIQSSIHIPSRLKESLHKPIISEDLGSEFRNFKEYLLSYPR